MGMLKRLSSVVRGKVNRLLGYVEDPIEQIDIAIAERSETLTKAKLESASFIGSVVTIREEVEELEKELERYEEGILKAVAEGDDDKARKFISQKAELAIRLANTVKTYNTVKDAADKAKEQIVELQGNIRDMKLKRADLLSRYRCACTQVKVSALIHDLSYNSGISIEEIEDKVKEKENYANGLEELRISTMPVVSELDSYLGNSIDIEDELQKYKKGGSTKV